MNYIQVTNSIARYARSTGDVCYVAPGCCLSLELPHSMSAMWPGYGARAHVSHSDVMKLISPQVKPLIQSGAFAHYVMSLL